MTDDHLERAVVNVEAAMLANRVLVVILLGGERLVAGGDENVAIARLEVAVGAKVWLRRLAHRGCKAGD